MRKRDLERLVRRVEREQKRLQPLLPDVDPHDLNLILSSLFRPIAQRRFFIRRSGSSYVF